MNRKERRASKTPKLSHQDVLDQVGKLRAGLKMMRENPNVPHCIQHPTTGEIIDCLDGETDALLDMMELMATKGRMEN